MDSLEKADIDKAFGKIFKHYREINGFTQEDLSECIEISPKYMSRIENGNGGIKTKNLINYMNVLSISPNMLYKDFITNPKLKTELEICEGLHELSEKNVSLVLGIINLLKNTNHD